MKGSSFYKISTSLVTLPMHASDSFHQSFSITRIHHTSKVSEKKAKLMQATICNAQSNAPYKFMSLLPLFVCFKF
jgi:hypothetical protein